MEIASASAADTCGFLANILLGFQSSCLPNHFGLFQKDCHPLRCTGVMTVFRNSKHSKKGIRCPISSLRPSVAMGSFKVKTALGLSIANGIGFGAAAVFSPEL